MVGWGRLLCEATSEEDTMTAVRETTVISEALTVIDKALAEMLNRELVSTDEVADLLLDLRLLLTASAELPTSD